MPKEPYNHELSAVCRYLASSSAIVVWHYRGLWTVLLATGLNIETLYLHMHAHISLVHAHEIFCQYDIF